MRAIAALVALVVCAGVAAGCGSSSSRLTTSTRASLPSTPVQQIKLARASNRVFSIFPTAPGQKKCGIPEGGVHFGPLPGVCVTSIQHPIGAGRVAIVSFTEKWPFPSCPRGADCIALSGTRHHVWRVLVAEPPTATKIRVVGTSERGSVAPQYYK